uniref:Uncharacterized protein n=1 Tax=Prolemur simus TaxID=1328070 RepID=A0A8C9AH95_PROSS
MAEGQVLALGGQSHLLGCLAAIVVKQVLLGRKVMVVCYEGINISSNFYSNKLKYQAFFCKGMDTNPALCPYHFQAPRRIFWWPLHERQAVPQDQGRPGCPGPPQVFDGIPLSYDKKKWIGVLAALKVVCMKPTRKSLPETPGL